MADVSCRSPLGDGMRVASIREVKLQAINIHPSTILLPLANDLFTHLSQNVSNIINNAFGPGS